MKYLTVALAKGRLAEIAMDMFINIGLDCSQMRENTRKLIFTDEVNKMRFILVKASDVPTYVEYGAADIGIVGKDTILEESRNLYEMLDLGFGKCRMAVCGVPGTEIKRCNKTCRGQFLHSYSSCWSGYEENYAERGFYGTCCHYCNRRRIFHRRA